MARRITNTNLHIEQRSSSNKRRITDSILNLEYKPSTNKSRITKIIADVEYYPEFNILATQALLLVEYRPRELKHNAWFF